MKFLYRILIMFLIAVTCYALVSYPISKNADEIFSVLEDPVRSQFNEYVGGPSREYLSDGRKLIYDAMFRVLEQGASQVNIPVCGYYGSDVEAALLSLLNDCPQFFWVNYADCSYLFDDFGTTIYLSYLYDDVTISKMKNRFDSSVNEIVNAVKSMGFTNEYEKAVYVHDFIASTCEYDKSLSISDIHNAYGALVSKKAVCDGYAHAYQYVLQRLGIECHYVSGEARGPNGAEGHAWNIVKLDGTYTTVDLTWNDMDSYLFDELSVPGDDIISHIYFGISEEEMKKTHNVDENFVYPLPVAKDMNWFTFSGLAGKTVESIADKASDILIKSIDKAAPFVEIQITDRDAFQEFLDVYTGDIIDATNAKLSEMNKEERLLNEMNCFVTSAERGCILILVLINTIVEESA